MAPFVRHGSGLLLALFSTAALAGDAVRLLPLPFAPQKDVLDKSAARFNALLIEELNARELTLLSPLKPGDKPLVPGKAPSPEAVAAMDRGRAAMTALNFRGAIPELTHAVTLYLGDAATADFNAVNEGYLDLAVASFRLGHEADAERALTTLLRFNAAVQLPAKKFAPPFMRMVDRVRARVERGAHGTVTVDGPAGSRAFVDGRLAGSTPVRAEWIAGGEHYVRVEGPQGELWGQKVDVDGDEAVKAVFLTSAQIALLTAAPPASQPLLDTEFEQHLRAYCQAVEADFALVGIVFHEDNHRLVAAAAVYSAQKGAFSLLEPRAMDELMSGANVEAFRVAEDAAAALRAFGEPAVLPVNLRARPPPTHQLPIETAQGDPALREQMRPRLIPDGPPLGPTRPGGEPVERPGRPAETPDQWAANVPWWGWTLIGLGAGLAVGGAAYAILQATHPPGTLVAQW